jgi:glucose-1-phosphate thymidylyltransferase
MKGIVLAGGLGKRLYPLSRITNKHLLPVFSKPMIYYPIRTLVEAGIKDVLIVVGGNNAGDFVQFLGNGKEFGFRNIDYVYQRGEKGIADALKLAECFANREKIVVILGDNIIERSIKKYIRKFAKQTRGAMVLLKSVLDPREFGVATLQGKKIIAIEEKPKKPCSNYVTIGIYMYDSQVFDIIRTLKPSKRGELEITDVNNIYLNKGELSYDFLDGFWCDCGTFDSLLMANNFIAKKEKRK